MHRGACTTSAVSCFLLIGMLTGCSSGEHASDDVAGAAPSSGTSASSSAASRPAAATPTGPAPAAGRVVFSDEMDDDRNGWGAGGGSAFIGGDYVEKATVPVGLAGWPDALVNATPASVIVTARMSAPTGSAVLAVTCNNVFDGQGGGEFYALGISSDGTFISRTTSYAQTPLEKGVLANAGTTVDLTAPHDVQGSCVLAGNEMDLWLSIDGQQVLSAVDADPLDAGPPGLQMVGAEGDGSAFEGHVASFSVAEPA